MHIIFADLAVARRECVRGVGIDAVGGELRL